MFSPQ
uniref:Peptide encoded by miPEP160b n=1 Tax=Arabidopsis thaliana TaxID=3702 RepID=P160B_ARATH